MIQGTIRSGCGRASQAFQPARMAELQQRFGWTPYPGTLNVAVMALDAAVLSLGEPVFRSEHNTPIGPLQWWPVLIRTERTGTVNGLLVRGARTGTRYLELVSRLSFRAAGCQNGDLVSIQRAP